MPIRVRGLEAGAERLWNGCCSRGKQVGRSLLAALWLALLALPAGGQTEPIELPTIEVHAPYPLTPAKYRGTPLPSYPTAAREQGVEGAVLLAVHVFADGRVGEIQLIASSASPDLDAAAVKAVKEWTFVPARRGPRFVDSWVEVPVKFALRSK